MTVHLDMFDFVAANEERKRHIAFICQVYGVSPFWAHDMTWPEIDWFEEQIFNREGAD